jgi:hypothetical protein
MAKNLEISHNNLIWLDASINSKDNINAQYKLRSLINHLQIINEFKENYSLDKSIWWYKRETFLYRLLNESLRTQNIDLLFGLRFLIRLYRGQLISDEELDILKQSKGKLISMNSFFSTTLNRQVGLFFILIHRLIIN